jgi:hypothetical protein
MVWCIFVGIGRDQFSGFASAFLSAYNCKRTRALIKCRIANAYRVGNLQQCQSFLKKMSKQIKILLINGGIAMVCAIFFSISSLSFELFIEMVGLMSIVVGLLNVVVAIACFLAKDSVTGQGCLLSSGVLLLVGFSVCSSMWK